MNFSSLEREIQILQLQPDKTTSIDRLCTTRPAEQGVINADHSATHRSAKR